MNRVMHCTPTPEPKPEALRDLSYGEALLAVRWHEVQYACQQKVYPRKAFTEQMPGLPAGAVESLPT